MANYLQNDIKQDHPLGVSTVWKYMNIFKAEGTKQKDRTHRVDIYM